MDDLKDDDWYDEDEDEDEEEEDWELDLWLLEDEDDDDEAWEKEILNNEGGFRRALKGRRKLRDTKQKEFSYEAKQ